MKWCLVKICSLPSCNNSYKAKGYCDTHYCRIIRRGYIGDPKIIDRHGESTTPEYHIWSSIKDRCLNKKCKSYPLYGARGIKICLGWSGSFVSFYHDMGARTCDNYSIDRIDNDLNYSCGHCDECVENGWTFNCRWADATTQRYNQRPKPNKTGYPGVSMVGKKYRSRVTDRNKLRVDLGLFYTPEEAHAAILEWKKSND